MDKSFPFTSTAHTTLSCIFLMDAGSQLRGWDHRNKEEDVKERKKQDILYFYKMCRNLEFFPLDR